MTSQKVTSSIIQESKNYKTIQTRTINSYFTECFLPNLQHFSMKTGVNKPTGLILKKQYCSGGGNEIS